jgi:hypothetical protein
MPKCPFPLKIRKQNQRAKTTNNNNNFYFNISSVSSTGLFALIDWPEQREAAAALLLG